MLTNPTTLGTTDLGKEASVTESVLVQEISQDVLQARVTRVRSWMAENKADVLVVFSAPAVLGSRTQTAGYARYLTGWMTTGAPAMVVLPLDGRPTIITMGPHDTRVFEQRAAWFGDVVAAGPVDNYPGAVLRAVRDCAPGRIATLGVGELGGDQVAVLHAGFEGHPLIDAGPAVHEMRLVRHAEEVALHRIGARISDAMIGAAMEQAVVPGMTGARLMAAVEHAGRDLGAGTATTWLTVDEKPITTCMEQIELQRPVGAGDRVQLGTTLTYQGYFAQGLRIGTLAKPSPKLLEYGRILQEIQDAALAVMRPGAKLHQVSDVVEAAIDKFCPYDRDTDPFRFQACHGLGLTYVEPGMARDLNARRDKTIDPAGVEMAENMVIEVHPNFTHPELGHVCAGDMALVTSDGAEWMTDYPRGIQQL